MSCRAGAPDNAICSIVRLQDRTIWMKNKEKPFCESAQRTKSYVTDEQKGFDTVIRQIVQF